MRAFSRPSLLRSKLNNFSLLVDERKIEVADQIGIKSSSIAQQRSIVLSIARNGGTLSPRSHVSSLVLDLGGEIVSLPRRTKGRSLARDVLIPLRPTYITPNASETVLV